jgi:hypothetical protein
MDTDQISNGSTRIQNLDETERWASMFMGGALMALGLSRRSLTGLALAAIGGSLVFRGKTGHCPVYREFGLSTHGKPLAPTTNKRRTLSPSVRASGSAEPTPEAASSEGPPSRARRTTKGSEPSPRTASTLDPGQRIAELGEPVPWIK